MEQQIYMTPKQPFFVTSSEVYSKYIMNQLGIVHFYQCRTGDQPCFAVPDGCVDMVFCCDEDHPYAKLCGTVMTAKTGLTKANTRYFGVRFLPGYNPILRDCGVMSELVDNRMELELFSRDKEMMEEIFSAADFQEQIRIFLHAYKGWYADECPAESASLLVRHSMNLLIRSGGCMTVEQLAEDAGYTVRYLNKVFRRETGLSPKQLAKIIRFQKAVSVLNEPNGRILTDITAELGYFDQSHFVRDFKEYTGFTPGKYQAYLETQDYCHKLNII